MSFQPDFPLISQCVCVRVRVRGCNISKYSGSTVDAMSDAIEGADVMLYGVSLRYKESANVRFIITLHYIALHCIASPLQYSSESQGFVCRFSLLVL